MVNVNQTIKVTIPNDYMVIAQALRKGAMTERGVTIMVLLQATVTMSSMVGDGLRRAGHCCTMLMACVKYF